MNVDQFPIEIRHLMMYRQKEEIGKKDWSVFQNDRSNGFTWEPTPERYNFWYEVIRCEMFDVFYAKYPKVDYPKDMPEEIIMLALDRRVEQGWSFLSPDSFGFGWSRTPEEHHFWSAIHQGKYNVYYEKYGSAPTTDVTKYKGRIADFPPEIVEMMLQRQFEQTGKRDVTVFENLATADCRHNGFTWEDSPEKNSFWNDVIRYKRFDIFFEKYPKKESLINSHIKTKQNEKGNTTSSNTGIEVQRPIATISTGERRTASGVSGRRSFTTVTSRRIGYKTIIGF
jgi:hypothetical protein